MMSFPGGWDCKETPVMQKTQVWFLGWEDPLEKGMATYSSILAWRIPWTEKPGGLHPIGYDWVTDTNELTNLLLGFPSGSGSKESTCNAGDWVWSLCHEDPLGKWMATHPSILACIIWWTEEPGELQSIGSQRVGYGWATKHAPNPWLQSRNSPTAPKWCSVQLLSHANSLPSHGWQHTRFSCPSPTPGACSNSCPSNWWCHPTISSVKFFFD